MRAILLLSLLIAAEPSFSMNCRWSFRFPKLPVAIEKLRRSDGLFFEARPPYSKTLEEGRVRLDRDREEGAIVLVQNAGELPYALKPDRPNDFVTAAELNRMQRLRSSLIGIRNLRVAEVERVDRYLLKIEYAKGISLMDLARALPEDSPLRAYLVSTYNQMVYEIRASLRAESDYIKSELVRYEGLDTVRIWVEGSYRSHEYLLPFLIKPSSFIVAPMTLQFTLVDSE